MRVKCKICGKLIEKTDAYCVEKSYGRFYYCSAEEIEEKKKQNKKNASERAKETIHKIDPVYEAVAEILGYRTQNSIFFNEMKLWRGICNDDTILAYLAENKSFLSNAMQKDFNNEYGKIRYFSAILKNNLGNYKISYKPVQAPVKVEVDNTMYEPTVSKKRKRRSLSELEDEV